MEPFINDDECCRLLGYKTARSLRQLSTFPEPITYRGRNVRSLVDVLEWRHRRDTKIAIDVATGVKRGRGRPVRGAEKTVAAVEEKERSRRKFRAWYVRNGKEYNAQRRKSQKENAPPVAGGEL